MTVFSIRLSTVVGKSKEQANKQKHFAIDDAVRREFYGTGPRTLSLFHTNKHKRQRRQREREKTFSVGSQAQGIHVVDTKEQHGGGGGGGGGVHRWLRLCLARSRARKQAVGTEPCLTTI